MTAQCTFGTALVPLVLDDEGAPLVSQVCDALRHSTANLTAPLTRLEGEGAALAVVLAYLTGQERGLPGEVELNVPGSSPWRMDLDRFCRDVVQPWRETLRCLEPQREAGEPVPFVLVNFGPCLSINQARRVESALRTVADLWPPRGVTSHRLDEFTPQLPVEDPDRCRWAADLVTRLAAERDLSTRDWSRGQIAVLLPELGAQAVLAVLAVYGLSHSWPLLLRFTSRGVVECVDLVTANEAGCAVRDARALRSQREDEARARTRRARMNLRRRPGEADEPYRQRVLAVIGAHDSEARLDAYAVSGACLDRFAGTVAHAEFIGWGRGAGEPRAHHEPDCRCPRSLRRLVRDVKDAKDEARVAHNKAADAKDEAIRAADAAHRAQAHADQEIARFRAFVRDRATVGEDGPRAKFDVAHAFYTAGRFRTAIDCFMELAFQYPESDEGAKSAGLALACYRLIYDDEGLVRAGQRLLAKLGCKGAVWQQLQDTVAAAQQRLKAEA